MGLPAAEPSGERVVASELPAPWYAVYVTTPRPPGRPSDSRDELSDLVAVELEA